MSQSNNTQKNRNDKNRSGQNQLNYVLSYLIFAFLCMWLFQQFIIKPITVRETEITYSEFKSKIKSKEVSDVLLGEYRIVGMMKNPNATSAEDEKIPFTTVAMPNGDPTLIELLDENGINYTISEPANPLGSILLGYLIPLLFFGVIWYLISRQVEKSGGSFGGLGGIMSIGQSKATEVKPEDVNVTFKDVGGADEAIEELQDIIQFLKEPEQFSKLGGRIPKGVLLVGPPGTGKTLLAKATAGEAHVPFFETSGSEFVEMFVGVGAARVRNLFDQARKVAPAIIFIDEIDAIGQSRVGPGRFGSNDEREQTLNQLLSEIDGFKSDKGKPVIIMAATNRPEILDPALLRAGRFDRQVTVSIPDLIGRKQILQIHSKNIKLDPSFDLDRAARMTPGFSGADLANVMNEAALLAARRNGNSVNMDDFELAIERIVAGLEKKTRVMNEKERTAVAYHESGHALIGEIVPNGDPVAKVSIVPRGRGALGYTMQMPTEDRYLMTQSELEDKIAVLLGGRAAESIIFNEISTGAADDIKKATELARRMVTEFGMSEKLGVVRYATPQYQFLESYETAAVASPETLKLIDEEVQRILDEQFKRVINLLNENRDALESLTKLLLEKETISGEEVKEAIAKQRIKEPAIV